MKKSKFVTLKEGKKKEDIHPEAYKAMHVDWGQNVHLKSGLWVKHYMPKNCRIVKEWQVVNLWVHNNKHATILKEIRHIRFPSLKWLCISANKIVSLEGITRIFMPSLEGLEISKNYLISARPVLRGSWANLTEVYLSNNPIRDWSILTQLPIDLISERKLRLTVEENNVAETDKRSLVKTGLKLCLYHYTFFSVFKSVRDLREALEAKGQR